MPIVAICLDDPPGRLSFTAKATELVYPVQIPHSGIYEAVLLKLPDDLVNAGDSCAESLGVSRAEYIRRAIARMNDETTRARRARDLIRASKKVRAESARQRRVRCD